MEATTFVKGTSKVLGIIGNPVSHSISPVIQNTMAKYFNHDLVYVPFCVEGEHLKTCLDGAHQLGIEGLNVTVPHKKNIMPYLESLDEGARQIGAVNTLKKTANGYRGYNTDILGLQKTFENESISLEHKKIVLLGAGGAARAAGLLAAQKNAKEIYIVNRNMDNAKNLTEHILTYYKANISHLPLAELKNELNKIGNIDIVIQSTSVGMHPHTTETVVDDLEFFNNTKVAFDMIYTPWKTLFLSMAEKCSAKIINGFDMLIYQAIAAYEIWNEISIKKNDAVTLKNVIKEYFLSR